MAAVAGDNSSLATQCLDLCQTLASQGLEFTFSVNIGPSFIFSLDTRKKTSEVKPIGKRPSPSTLRRNASRREAFLKKKAQPPASSLVTPKMTKDSIIISEDFKCTQCDSPFKSEEQLKTHIADKHTVPVLKTPEKERSLPPISDLTLTPVLGEEREEPLSSVTCENCQGPFSADHQCDNKEVKLKQWEIDKYVCKRCSKYVGSTSGYLFEHKYCTECFLWEHDRRTKASSEV